MSGANKTIIIFTESFPYSSAAEDTFIIPELKALKASFERIIIAPLNLDGVKADLDPDCILNRDYSRYMHEKNIFRKISNIFMLIISPLFYSELIARPSVLTSLKLFNKLRKHILMAKRTNIWVEKFINREKIDIRNTIFYSYWFTSVLLGIGMIKINRKDAKIIGRAHGIDVYEKRHLKAYLPLREVTLKFVDGLFLSSDNSKDHLIKKYPLEKEKFKTQVLGITDPGFECRQSQDGIFRIVSCSFVLPVKRLDLLAMGLAVLGKNCKNRTIEWTHLGGGGILKELKKLTHAIMPKSISCIFRGNLTNKDVIQYYRDNPVDLFMNVSSSEGGRPVSIMEAQSCSIPVIATDVGGNPEIVSNEVGRLIGSDPKPEEIASVIEEYMNSSTEKRELLRDNSKKNWEKNYSADKNFECFSDSIFKMLR